MTWSFLVQFGPMNASHCFFSSAMRAFLSPPREHLFAELWWIFTCLLVYATGNPWRLCFGSTHLACCLGGAFLFQQKDDILPDSTSFWNECQESLMFFWDFFLIFLLLSLECQNTSATNHFCFPLAWQTFLDQKLPIQSTTIVCEKEDSSAVSFHSAPPRSNDHPFSTGASSPWWSFWWSKSVIHRPWSWEIVGLKRNSNRYGILINGWEWVTFFNDGWSM